MLTPHFRGHSFDDDDVGGGGVARTARGGSERRRCEGVQLPASRLKQCVITLLFFCFLFPPAIFFVILQEGIIREVLDGSILP